MNREELYQQHLHRVSRSFAFCIEQLEAPLRQWVGLAYLLFRIVDTIEDSPWSDGAAQMEAFEHFGEFLRDRPAASQVQVWRLTFPEKIPEGERLLLDETTLLLDDLYALPDSPHTIIKEGIFNMIRGMQYFSKQMLSQDRLRLENLSQVNQYCFFVAGVIGELLSHLLARAYGGLNISHRMLVDAFHFGLYLQKINLLKDQRKDETEGRYFVPSRAEVRASLIENARHGFEYLSHIPIACRGYRIFCAWSYFLGLLSLSWIDKSWELQQTLQISRDEVFTYLHQVKVHIDDNRALQQMAEVFGVFAENAEPRPFHASTILQAWWRGLYKGELANTDFGELGLLESPT